MKKIAHLFTVLIIGVLGYACNATSKEKQPKEVSATVQELKPSPIRHDTLSVAQLKDIETIHATFSKVYPISLNESIKNFKRDQDPSREIQIWLKMVESFNSLTRGNKYSTDLQRQEVFSVILASTMMSVEKIKADVELHALDESEIDEINTTFMNSFSAQ